MSRPSRLFGILRGGHIESMVENSSPCHKVPISNTGVMDYELAHLMHFPLRVVHTFPRAMSAQYFCHLGTQITQTQINIYNYN